MVIAIIAILAAILFPVFAQAKEAAKKATCLSNEKQLATGLHMYAGDSDDVLCQTSWEQTNQYQVHWTYLLQPYIKNWGIFVCPSDAEPVLPKYPCKNLSELGKVPMVCDWQAPSYSVIPNYNMLPAHDWLPGPMTEFADYANVFMVTERRAKLDKGTVIGPHKGVSGFNPT